MPELISPINNAIVDNGREDGTNELVWEFDWSDCPSAKAYELYVIGPHATIPLIPYHAQYEITDSSSA